MALQYSARRQGAALDECAACNTFLSGSYYTLLGRPERYCPDCIANRPRCASCGAPVGAEHWKLHDGRLQCAFCHATAVYDSGLAQTIFDETVTAIVAQFGMHLNVGVVFRLVDAPTLADIHGEVVPHGAGEERPTLGLYQRQGHMRAIYLLYGLPRLIFRTTTAHEYAHAWQGENCPLLSDEILREGFAEWVAYQHLRFIGCSIAADRMLTAPHPYRPALEYVLSLEQRLGQRGVIEYVRRAE
jgi:hypothetical protein